MRVRTVKGAPQYFVTDTGEVYNKKGHQLRLHLNKVTGYYQVGLRIQPGRVKTFGVHRLVAEAYVSNPSNLYTVNHLDGNKQNNRAENLEWTDKRGNAVHAYQIGLRTTTAVAAYTRDGKLYKTFPSVKEAMAFCGVSYNAGISNCLRGKAPTAHGYVWKYAPGGARP